MKLTTKVALEVASHEAVIRQAYKDSVGATFASAQKLPALLATRPLTACSKRLLRYRFFAQHVATACRLSFLKQSACYLFAPVASSIGSCPERNLLGCQSDQLKVCRHNLTVRPNLKNTETLPIRGKRQSPARHNMKTAGVLAADTLRAFPSISDIAGFLTCRGFLTEHPTPHFGRIRMMLISRGADRHSRHHEKFRSHTGIAKWASHFLSCHLWRERSKGQNAGPSNLSVVDF